MARGGINKLLVKQARDALMTRGENPSIDRVRIELGNTGSKATIHRYLKELEEEESARLDDEALLSNALKEMVAKLASKLHTHVERLGSRTPTCITWREHGRRTLYNCRRLLTQQLRISIHGKFRSTTS